MNAIAKFENLKDLIVELRGQSVLREVDWYKDKCDKESAEC
jgi:hypothetical protein